MFQFLTNTHVIVFLAVWFTVVWFIHSTLRKFPKVSYEDVVRTSPVTPGASCRRRHIPISLITTVAVVLCVIWGVRKVRGEPEFLQQALHFAEILLKWLHSDQGTLFVVPWLMLWLALFITVVITALEIVSILLEMEIAARRFPDSMHLHAVLPGKWAHRFQHETVKIETPKGYNLVLGSFLVICLLIVFGFEHPPLLWAVIVMIPLWAMLSWRTITELCAVGRRYAMERKRWIDVGQLAVFHRRYTWGKVLRAACLLPALYLVIGMAFSWCSFDAAGVRCGMLARSMFVPWKEVPAAKISLTVREEKDDGEKARKSCPEFDVVLDLHGDIWHLNPARSLTIDEQKARELLGYLRERIGLNFDDTPPAVNALLDDPDCLTEAKVLREVLSFR